MKIINEIETIKKLQEGCSISRFGDGEFRLMNGKNMVYQDYNKDIVDKLKNILSQKKNPEKLLVGIPPFYDNTEEHLKRITNKKVLVYWEKYMKKKESKDIEPLLNHKKNYYSSFISRIESFDYNKEEYLRELSKVWENKNVILVLNENKYNKISNLIISSTSNTNSITKIFCAEKNAYFDYTTLLNNCTIYSKGVLFLLMIGPTATILSYDLCCNGYQALDIGSFFELYI